jgi:peptidoglycan/LPS O-acetylase OafA/YrhL
VDYRREIDGLRAVAVLPVILFHAGFQIFSGGFVGVDVFFVISGYLITSIIVAEQEAGTFTLLNFYERRARRILPALFFVMLACLPFAWMWSLPSDAQSFSDSLIAVSTFCSNILFWFTSGYFEHDAELKPLLHTWSLAVEEQYYLFFPLFLMLMRRFSARWLLPSLVVMAAISLALAQWISDFSQPTAFYNLSTRGWELLIGAFVAFYFLRHPKPSFNKSANQIGSILGLLLLIYAILAFDSQTPFPSLYTLVPTLGTALIILFATQQTLIGKLLGHDVFVGIGLISYSAYLWHQPLFAFARQRAPDEPSKSLLLALALIAMVLAYFSWKYIEAPFRSRKRFTRRQIFMYSGAMAAFFIAIGTAGHQSRIKTLWQIRNPELTARVEPINKPVLKDCNEPLKMRGFTSCKVTGTGNKRVVLWGDSHAGMLAMNAAPTSGVELYSLWHLICPPVIGVRRLDDRVTCNDTKILENYAEFIKSLSPDVIVIAARWTMYIDGWHKLGVLQPEHHFLSDSDTDSSIKPLAERKAMLHRQLEKTIRLLTKNSKVILLTQVPEFQSIGFRRMERSNLSLPLNTVLEWHKDEADIFANLHGMPNLTIIDTKKLFCDHSVCRTRDNGSLLYMDEDHLSPLGTELTWQIINAELVKDLKK